ncbi:MAG: 2-amino-4-hydroxy-6-hydroxymethyldihydropteridine pyrophosphokinase [Cycloclasticus sp. symbiont of Poecilosclerida sp. M]|nr:MAG: 2-amino-4-hydroxy-6-hydroxymethyldihydropteridine pyrophosphokinase [Cycloclasticus sp. symbiont of Poecilosclerida sp. M]
MTTVYLSIGSNIEREHHIRLGISALKKHFGELTLSSVYESAAVGFEGDAFLNLIATFDTKLEPKVVNNVLTQIEKQNGRTAEQKKFNPRTLDLDMLLYGDFISKNQSLNIPRDEITQYPFVLEPLAEIAGNLLHPVLQTSYADLWRDFDKHELAQQKVSFGF